MTLEHNENKESDQIKHNNFRKAAAGLIKSLIRARAREESDFISAKDYKRWGVTGLNSENRTCANLLKQVRRLRERFEANFLQEFDSIPEPGSGEPEDSFDSLIERVAGFIDGDLDEAISNATKDKKIRWDQLADWNGLATLRDALDKLPSSSSSGSTAVVRPTVPVPIFRRSSSSDTIEWRGIQHPVDAPTAIAFEVMINAIGQPVGLSKYLRKPKQWLKKLEQNVPELAAIVARGKGNSGYRLTIFDPPADTRPRRRLRSASASSTARSN